MSLPEKNSDFLVMTCEDVGFLVNRNQFTSSLYIDAVKTRNGLPSCCAGIIDYGGEALLLCDFHGYLRSLFRFKPVGSADLALIISTAALSPRFGELFRSMVQNQEVNDRYLALRITNQSSIDTVPIASLRPLPSMISASSMTGGILGLRFIIGNSIQYFIDLDIMITNMLAGAV